MKSDMFGKRVHVKVVKKNNILLFKGCPQHGIQNMCHVDKLNRWLWNYLLLILSFDTGKLCNLFFFKHYYDFQKWGIFNRNCCKIFF